jgi:hypothetical protein
MNYVQVRDELVVNRAVFEEPMPQDWPEYETWHQSDEAQIGWSYDGTTFSPPMVTPSFSDTLNMGGTIREIIGG